LTTLDYETVEENAEATFEQADLDDSGALDADEFAALSIVTAELSMLNGFLSYKTDDGLQTVALPVAAPHVVSRHDKTRLDAVARRAFYRAAGEDAALSAEEFVGLKTAAFHDADNNGNGRLSRSELDAFALGEATFVLAGA
ncbi:MAG: hypothetical protein AAGJ87_11200, partial [Pseudomonadota bacterium]